MLRTKKAVYLSSTDIPPVFRISLHSWLDISKVRIIPHPISMTNMTLSRYPSILFRLLFDILVLFDSCFDILRTNVIRLFFQQRIVRYIGQTHVAEGNWLGIELPKPEGKNDGSDGSLRGERYLSCLAFHGLFVSRTRNSSIGTCLEGGGQ